MDGLANTPKPPYYAVIFTSIRTDNTEGYHDTAEKMQEYVSRQPGYLGMESVKEGEKEITVSYWQSIEDIMAWKKQVEHQEAQRLGQEKWYRDYRVRIARIEHDYGSTG